MKVSKIKDINNQLLQAFNSPNTVNTDKKQSAVKSTFKNFNKKDLELALYLNNDLPPSSFSNTNINYYTNTKRKAIMGSTIIAIFSTLLTI